MVSEKRINIFIVTCCFIFSWWLFGKSFGYDNVNHAFRIARNEVGDFGLHLSIIRSISLGNNFPPQSPFFPGRPLAYHWGTDVFIGILERIGVPIDWAINGVSAVGMTILLWQIYVFSQILFRRKLIGLASIVLFLFPSTLTIVNYLRAPSNIWRLPDYIDKGPFDGSSISIYQTLNPYLNQRHLVVGLAIGLFVINYFLRKKPISSPKLILLGLLVGMLYKVHSLIAISTASIIFFQWLVFRKQWIVFFVMTLLVWVTIALFEGLPKPLISFYFGYLSTGNILAYWWMNMGLSLPFLLLGFYMVPKKARLVFLSFLPLFIIANTIQLSFRIEHNHSLINFFWIVVSTIVAFVLVKIFDRSKLVAVVLFGFLISSGILNLMAVKNDYQAYFDDGPQRIKKNTAPNAIFLTTRSLYDPAALAGRFTYVGPSYYLEVMGIDYQERAQFAADFYKNSQLFAQEARERGIDYYILPDGSIHAL